MSEPNIKNILIELGMPTGPRETGVARPVLRSRLMELMGSDDPEVLGIVYSFINSERAKMVGPPLIFGDYHLFTLRYYERCLREDPDGDWSDSRYSAGWDLVNWFAILWRDNDIPKRSLNEIKDMLARLYTEGDDELRTCIVTATLEHLFEQEPIRKFFDDWKSDPVLALAYSEAIQWREGGGKSPLCKRTRRR
jgi:hypothetical protein